MRDYIQSAEELKTVIDKNQETADAVDYCGGMRIEREESDKSGQDWLTYYVGNTVVRQDYIPADPTKPNGSFEQPYPFEPGMKMKQNAWYTDGETKKSWFGKQGAICESFDDPNLVEM